MRSWIYAKAKKNIMCLIMFLWISIMSCNNIEYSPSQVFDGNSFENINAKNLVKIGDGKGDDTIRFIVTGDTQRSYEEAVPFYKKVNSMPGIDFVIVAGDVTEFGTLKEMQWLAERFNRLTAPYVVVIGNHDLTSRGRESFQRMYGDLNYSFVYGGIKFICHDTNSREYLFNGHIPNIPWLKKELAPEEGVSNYVAISHVPPVSRDFDSALLKDYAEAFHNTPGFLTSFHAHDHNFRSFRLGKSTVPYIVTSAMSKQEFTLVEIINNKLRFEQIPF
jgi:Icc protein